jgi:hypothetical protein
MYVSFLAFLFAAVLAVAVPQTTVVQNDIQLLKAFNNLNVTYIRLAKDVVLGGDNMEMVQCNPLVYR